MEENLLLMQRRWLLIGLPGRSRRLGDLVARGDLGTAHVQPDALLDQRVAEVEMMKQHEGCRRIEKVFDGVEDLLLRLPEHHAHGAREAQLSAEKAGLGDGAGEIQHGAGHRPTAPGR